MKFTLCTENKVFPYMLVDDFYTTEEQFLIWEELEYYRRKNLYKDGKRPDSYGVSSVANLNRIYLEELYPNNREDSNILTVYKKILSEEVLEKYRQTTPAARQFENTNYDCSVVNYYEDLNEETFTKMLINLKQSKQIKSGSQIGRISSEPMKFDN